MNSVAVSSTSSSVAATVVSGSIVSSAVSSTTLHTAHSMSSIAEHISPLLNDDSSQSSSCLPSTPVNDKPLHYPKKVRLPLPETVTLINLNIHGNRSYFLVVIACSLMFCLFMQISN